jgi:hypothetical protein
MALKMVLESLDDVPEALHEHYAEKDGKFILDADGVDEHPAVANLRNAYRAEQDKRRKVADDLKQANERLSVLPEDFDADEYSQLKADFEARKDDPDAKDVRKQIEAATAALKAQHEVKIANFQKKYDADIGVLNENLSTKDSQLRRRLVDDELTTSLRKAGVAKESYVKAAKMLLESDVEVVEEDGAYVARMKAELGGDDIAKYVSNWVQSDDGKDFITPASGGDAPGGNGRGGGQPRKAGDMGGTREERKQAIAARHPELAKAG